MAPWQVIGLDEDMFWTVLTVGAVLVAVLALARYAGYFDKDDDLAE